MTQPWLLAEQIAASDDPSLLLADIKPTDPFWIGASYAIDPFVGIICRLPLADPKRFGGGAPARVFDKLVKGIIDGSLTGTPLVLGIEAFSRYCTEDEWTHWYRPILQGEMNLRLPLDLFNKFCPDELRIPPPALNKPKPIQSFKDLPRRFFLQPAYPSERVFWLVDSKNPPPDVRGYDAQARRFINQRMEGMLRAFAQSKPVDIVLTGFANSDYFLTEDLLSTDQFTRESGAFPLYRRLEALAQLGLPPVQMSDVLTPNQPDLLMKELGLIFEQGYEGAIIRDLDGHYPFRTQPDLLVRPSVKSIATVVDLVDGVGLKFEFTRAKKKMEGIVRLGLTAARLGDISDSRGKRFELLSCGAKDNQLLLPVFKRWRNE